MRLLKKLDRFDDLGFAIFLFAPVSLLFVAALTSEALAGRLPQQGVAFAHAPQHPMVNASPVAAQTPCPAAPAQTALANDLNRKSSHE
ncbi:MAG TPA: hypothetical protein VEI29_02325 [Burkholderiaceae bacterium]|nr:hypothetical protein [Burkholderiaceae bacterium]